MSASLLFFRQVVGYRQVRAAHCRRWSPCRQDRRQGFTLLELMIVVAIIGTLAAIGVPNYLRYADDARVAVAITMLRQIEHQANDYFLNHGSYPDNLAQIGYGKVLDPWGNPYQYLNVATATGKDLAKIRKDHSLHPVNNDYDLYSLGRDGRSQAAFTAKASRDDIVRAYDGAYFGRVADF